jgi:hypothetical protein
MVRPTPARVNASPWKFLTPPIIVVRVACSVPQMGRECSGKIFHGEHSAYLLAETPGFVRRCIPTFPLAVGASQAVEKRFPAGILRAQFEREKTQF